MFQSMLKGLKERRGSSDTMFMDSSSSFRAGSSSLSRVQSHLLTVSTVTCRDEAMWQCTAPRDWRLNQRFPVHSHLVRLRAGSLLLKSAS